MSEIRDAIYGFIEPTEVKWRIINSPLLQRFRKIRQLAWLEDKEGMVNKSNL